MKADWKFWLLLGIGLVGLYINLRVALGLQSAQTKISGYTQPLVDFFSKLGLK